MGEAIGATVTPARLDVKGFDAAVLVKRPSAGLIERLRREKVPIIWDVVDAYPQPAALDWTETQCKAWLRASVEHIKPVAIVAATAVMARDCREFGVPVLWLPHHSRPDQQQTRIYPEVRKVGYEGSDHYLGKWLPVLQQQCAQRGWQFIVNPPALSCLDIVVALREATGYAAANWKSGVKMSNAVGSGTPVIYGAEAGCAEISHGAFDPVTTEQELSDQMTRLSQHRARAAMHANFLERAPALSLASTAAKYKDWLCKLNF